MQRVLDDFIERGKKLRESDGVIELEESHTPENPRLRRIIRPDQQHPALHDFVRRAKYVEVVSRLLGPNIRLHFSKINLKMGGFGAPVHPQKTDLRSPPPRQFHRRQRCAIERFGLLESGEADGSRGSSACLSCAHRARLRHQPVLA